ncbi:DNA replication/repair protein RecF [Streptococcus massiliensis]|uniref:DNA replication and repair protein RecF n=1 Tax=Streptococcus massiliensis TaxID=313439 RepID=A0A380KX17_9STRE|nr:DNA replication/repair protein RecF [Streptococcus massiliensis]SUN76308.1 recombination protein recF [Streptococcus massiliensis]
MWLKNISLKSFRNYENLSVNFNPHFNIFLGKNAQGKTNILEAIYFLALTRSHRTRSDKELITFTDSQLDVKGDLQRSTSTIPLEIILNSKGRTTKVNQLKQAKLSNYIGKMNVILFAPEDLQLIKGAPALRRKFIDMELGQIRPIYLSDLANYHHVLKQRNAYLKNTEKIDENFLDVLDDQLTDFGGRVILHRIEFLKKLEDFSQRKHFDISGQTEKLNIKYLSSISFTDVNDIDKNFQIALQKTRSRDLFKKNTGVGPHRDDISFSINGMDVNFGSQGQHRSIILSVKLAEIELMKSVTKEYPILLLDDVMSELDNNRQVKLLETISQNIQTFITTTSLEHLKNLPEDIKIFNIEQGTVHEE